MRAFFLAPLFLCKTLRLTALSILLYAADIACLTVSIFSGVGSAVYVSTAPKYLFVKVLREDLYALLRSRLRSAVLIRLIADLELATGNLLCK